MDRETADRYKFGDFEVDRLRRVLRRDGEPIALNPKAFDLLLELIDNRGEIVTKDVLLERVWPGQFVEENNLTVQVSALRKAFGEKKGENRFIVTVSGNGYKFVGGADDEWDREIDIENRTIERIVIERDTTNQSHTLRLSRSWPVYAVSVLVVAGIATFFAYRYLEAA